jgi:hypothetical protein
MQMSNPIVVKAQPYNHGIAYTCCCNEQGVASPVALQRILMACSLWHLGTGSSISMAKDVCDSAAGGMILLSLSAYQAVQWEAFVDKVGTCMRIHAHACTHSTHTFTHSTQHTTHTHTQSHTITYNTHTHTPHTQSQERLASTQAIHAGTRTSVICHDRMGRLRNKQQP